MRLNRGGGVPFPEKSGNTASPHGREQDLDMNKKNRSAVLLTALLLILSLALAGCGGSGDSGKSETKDVDLDDFVTSVEKVNKVQDPRELEDFDVENELGLTMDNIDSFKGEITNSQDDCALIFIAKAKSGKASDVKDELESYKESLTSNDLYAENADKIANAEDARVEVHGDYVIMVVAGLDSSYDDIDGVIAKKLS